MNINSYCLHLKCLRYSGNFNLWDQFIKKWKPHFYHLRMSFKMDVSFMSVLMWIESMLETWWWLPQCYKTTITRVGQNRNIETWVHREITDSSICSQNQDKDGLLCRASARNSLPNVWDASLFISVQYIFICPDDKSPSNLGGTVGGLNSLFKSSSGNRASPFSARALFSCSWVIRRK